MLSFDKKSRPNILSILKMGFIDKIIIEPVQSIKGKKISN